MNKVYINVENHFFLFPYVSMTTAFGETENDTNTKNEGYCILVTASNY